MVYFRLQTHSNLLSEIRSDCNVPWLLGSFVSPVDLIHPADHHVTSLRIHSGIEILVTVAVQQSPHMVGHLNTSWIMYVMQMALWICSWIISQCREESLNTAVCTMLCHQTHDVTANFTSNVTEVRSVNFGLVTECHHYNACHVANIFHNRVCYHVLSLHYARIRSSGIILIPTLPLCQISFLSRPPLLSQPVEKNCILNQSITQSLAQLIWCPGTEVYASK